MRSPPFLTFGRGADRPAAAKPRDRRQFFWPMVVGTLLSPFLWPAVLPTGLKGPHTGFTSTAWLGTFCMLSLLAAILPVAGWAFASRGPFVILALGGVLLAMVYPVLVVPALSVVVNVWAQLPWPDKVIGALLAGIWLLFPLWLWMIWRTAMGRRG